MEAKTYFDHAIPSYSSYTGHPLRVFFTHIFSSWALVVFLENERDAQSFLWIKILAGAGVEVGSSRKRVLAIRPRDKT